MTNEEAINELRDRYLSISAYADKKQCDKANKAIDMAIQALEKQIPKKATEDEIIDALECRCCVFRPRCASCPHQDFCCIARIATDGLSLIRKQQAEINRLKKYDEERDIRLHARLIATAKAEAIKEFAKKFEDEFFVCDVTYAITKRDFHDFVKEMAGDTE